jgi:hypothetical protein
LSIKKKWKLINFFFLNWAVSKGSYSHLKQLYSTVHTWASAKATLVGYVPLPLHGMVSHPSGLNAFQVGMVLVHIGIL